MGHLALLAVSIMLWRFERVGLGGDRASWSKCVDGVGGGEGRAMSERGGFSGYVIAAPGR